MDRNELVRAMSIELASDTFSDYCPNGLQVEGSPEVLKVVAAVTASLNAIRHAQAVGAQMLLVHHGYFWKAEPAALVAMKFRRIQALINSEINLVAYHLPLDAHMEHGNNAQLAKLLGLSVQGHLNPANPTIGFRGELAQPMAGEAFKLHAEAVLGGSVTHINVDKPIKTVAWCTGAGQRFIDEAADIGVDAFISGEISEPTAHVARERGLHYFAAGHHATERYGVQALGEWLAQTQGVEVSFFDDANPA